jgi:UDP-GlcNAc:undecaprenyl-phosphate GlcNAc-1-phosphate transferase
MTLQYVILFATSFLSVGFLTPVMRLIALRMNIVDKPNERHKTHVVPIPYLGGIGIIIGVVGTTYTAILLMEV